jgi:hypothetical protein
MISFAALCGKATWDNYNYCNKSLKALAHPTRFERVTFAFGGQGFYAAARGITSFDPMDSSEYARPLAVI